MDKKADCGKDLRQESVVLQLVSKPNSVCPTNMGNEALYMSGRGHVMIDVMKNSAPYEEGNRLIPRGKSWEG